MIKSVDFPNRSFKNKEELFDALKANKEIIIAAKKAEIYKSCEKGLSVLSSQKSISKFIDTKKSIEFDENYYYFVVNSAKILDSHLDVHLDGNWDKSSKEQQGKVYFVFDHELRRTEIIAMKQDVEMFTAYIPFSALGKSYPGDTYSLVYKIKKDKIINAEAKEWLEKGYELECSVRMLYMDIDLAFKSEREGDEQENANFEKYYPVIVNKEDFEEIYYFWAIKQAKNVLESSWVLFGSNSATGRIEENKNEPGKSTQSHKEEPSDDTLEANKLLSLIKF